MRKPKPDVHLCAVPGCRQHAAPGGLYCQAHVTTARKKAEKSRLAGWLSTGRPEA